MNDNGKIIRRTRRLTPKRKVEDSLIQVIEDAAATIDGMALDLRMCNTRPPEHQDWAGDTECEKTYAHWRALVVVLYAHADRLRAVRKSMRRVR